MMGWVDCGSWIIGVWIIAAVRRARILASNAAFALAEALLRLSWKLDPNPPAIPTKGVDVVDEVTRLIAELEREGG